MRSAKLLLNIQRSITRGVPSRVVDRLTQNLTELLQARGTTGGLNIDDVIEYMIEKEKTNPTTLIQYLSYKVRFQLSTRLKAFPLPLFAFPMSLFEVLNSILGKFLGRMGCIGEHEFLVKL